MKSTISLSAIAAALSALPVAAQDATVAGDAPPPVAASAGATGTARQVFAPADFARYAPKNAYDMLVQVPGFSIRDNENLRGLGQATGNVLFNGERPSNKADDMYTQLSRIPAENVERIEIVDGATLDIPGLSGQVANIVYRADSISGQFSWKPEFRAHYTDALFTRADVSVRGRSGQIEYEAALSNDDSARSGAGGPTLIYDGAGNIIERREDSWNTHYDTPKLSGRITWDPPGDTVANLGGHYQRKYDRYYEDGVRTSPGTPDRIRTVYENADSWNYEVSGDYQFGFGPGKLKLIGLRRFSHEPYKQEIVTTPVGGIATGDRFAQTGDLGETIARGEYQWKLFGGDWQLSGEAAFNTLDNVASIAVLDPSGTWVGQPFDGGTGGVSEDRYEGLLSFGRKLTDKLTVQIVAGAEHSTITQTGANGLTRSFFRPKGSLTLAWAPSADFDASLKIRRRVLQLSFYDFLARAFLNDGNENQSNNDLRPQQDWSYELEINKKLGAWGSTKLYLVFRDVEDRVDVVPVGSNGGEGVGNIAKAKAGAVEWSSTINLDPAGIKGMKVESSALFQKSSLRDPFTGEKRQWSGFTDRVVDVSVRHDIPGSDWAWGAGANYSHYQPSYRRNQSDKVWEGPVFANVFVEHKNVMGLTVRAQIRNIANARSKRDRTVYTGVRGQSPIAFVEERDRLIGPIFAVSVRGNF
ncbi:MULTISPECIES: TonB-dependent receptor plug domain-containing protein [unclassified Sphingopyxis]|uniref:TonB-dependent receptor plug domain-containing protein n=1 Tax=unclassified Sphingopyxis TaxID=2614943 RepID=UPI000731CDB9|nr:MULTISPECIES: TonB-dependent receptor plug domain-containing protein [unclassified Sphingopyxis]KTE23734.1 TonB-dependent receptor [Sphingopyxis sp. H057]KTE50199.1 TonB-dependent receptor [Sphingopyxis sp. H073]KTE50588.1 TonB-dependent receptor [Sphingopyxis sp. H071]KTE59874.1 TonB-dependent receptor [Sphingopyxis sp. H107]KTE63657.1 TonB-dependent receptor [Sphingopyxis sp. H100]